MPATFEQFFSEPMTGPGSLWKMEEATGKVSDVLLPPPKPTKKPAASPRKSKLKRYGFSVTGDIYKIDDYSPEAWEALKKKLGKVVEVEAANMPDAWKEFEKKRGQQ